MNRISLLTGAIFAALIVAAGGSGNALAQEFDLSGSVSLGTEYVFRGFAQTDEDPTIQGSLDLGVGGFYLGIWGSNVDFNDGDEAHIEVDIYAGYAGEAGPVSLDGGVIWYTYPGAAGGLDYDYVEFVGQAGHDFGVASVNAGLYYSPEFFGKSGDATYLAGDVSIPIGDIASLDIHAGRQWISDNITFGSPDYWDFSVGLTVTVEGFDLSLTYHDTDLSDADLGDNDGADSRVVFAVGRAL